jgi:hypothetical protein
MVGSKVYSTIRNNIETKLNTSKQDRLTSEKYMCIYILDQTWVPQQLDA